MEKRLKLLPGIAYCLAIMLLSNYFANGLGEVLNHWQGLPSSSSSPISGIFVAIILGLLIRNLIGLQELFKAGVSFSIKYLLRLGIILLGIRLSFIDVLKLGAWGIPIILACIITGLWTTLWITEKMKQSQRLGILTAVGSGICGITAIMGTAPSIKATEEEVAYAVANVTIFGLMAMFFYPYLAYYFFQNEPIKVGLFLGTAIHDTSQVLGAALIYAQMHEISQAIDVAAITKLTRNFFLVAVVPLMASYYTHKVSWENKATSTFSSPKWYTFIPLFVLGFVAMSLVRTWGDSGINNFDLAFGILEPLVWQKVWSTISHVGANYLLGTAMAGVGLSTNLQIFKGLGPKPFLIGMVAALAVSLVSLLMIFLLGDYIVIY